MSQYGSRQQSLRMLSARDTSRCSPQPTTSRQCNWRLSTDYKQYRKALSRTDNIDRPQTRSLFQHACRNAFRTQRTISKQKRRCRKVHPALRTRISIIPITFVQRKATEQRRYTRPTQKPLPPTPTSEACCNISTPSPSATQKQEQ